MSLRQRKFDLIEHDARRLSMSEIEAVIPKKLYKYYGINEYTLNVLETSRLWFSAPQSFNDPFDCHIRVNLGSDGETVFANLERVFPDQYAHIWKDKNLKKAFGDAAFGNELFNEILEKAFAQSLGVCCFSEVATSPLMWAHYGSSHTGICLEFDTSSSNAIRDNVIPVQYYEEYPEFVLDSFGKNELSMFLLQLIASKGDDWDYEFEWRAVFNSGGNKLYDFDKSLLKKVIFGLRTKESEKQMIMELIKNAGYADMQYAQVALAKDKYRIEINEVQPLGLRQGSK